MWPFKKKRKEDKVVDLRCHSSHRTQWTKFDNLDAAIMWYTPVRDGDHSVGLTYPRVSCEGVCLDCKAVIRESLCVSDPIVREWVFPEVLIRLRDAKTAPKKKGK